MTNAHDTVIKEGIRKLLKCVNFTPFPRYNHLFIENRDFLNTALVGYFAVD